MNTATATTTTLTPPPATSTCFTCLKPSASHCCPACEAAWNEKAAALPPIPAIGRPEPSLEHFTRTVAGIVSAAADILTADEFAHFTADLIGGALLTAQDCLAHRPAYRRLAADALAHAQAFADLAGLPGMETLAASTQELHGAMCHALTLPQIADALDSVRPWRVDPRTGKTAPVPASLN